MSFVLVLMTLLLLGACGLSGGPFRGQVLEEGTHKPVSGAIVVVRWIGRTTSGSWFVEARDVCYHVETGVTDKYGRFETVAWSKEQHKDYTLEHHSVSVIAYKAGYGLPTGPYHVEDIVYLARFGGTTGERLDFLSRMVSATSCVGAGESYKNLYRMRYAMYEEAKAIARTGDGLSKAEWLRGIAEEALVNRSKPTRYDKHGRPVNVDPKDSFRPEDLR